MAGQSTEQRVSGSHLSSQVAEMPPVVGGTEVSTQRDRTQSWNYHVSPLIQLGLKPPYSRTCLFYKPRLSPCGLSLFEPGFGSRRLKSPDYPKSPLVLREAGADSCFFLPAQSPGCCLYSAKCFLRDSHGPLPSLLCPCPPTPGPEWILKKVFLTALLSGDLINPCKEPPGSHEPCLN